MVRASTTHYPGAVELYLASRWVLLSPAEARDLAGAINADGAFLGAALRDAADEAMAMSTPIGIARRIKRAVK